MAVEDVYLLALHQAYESMEHPAPINATIVHAASLLHPFVPQPDGGLMYRCLTEFPARSPGCVVPVSTLTYELDGGCQWPEIGDWGSVVESIVHLSRGHGCDAMALALPQVTSALLAGGPTTALRVVGAKGRSELGSRHRLEILAGIEAEVRGVVAAGPFWPGDNLLPPPNEPALLPYKPFGA